MKTYWLLIAFFYLILGQYSFACVFFVFWLITDEEKPARK